MASFRKPIEQPVDKRNTQELYSRYMVLALETRTTGDPALFEDYYQRAEYYLHLMNELSDGLPITPTRMVKSSQQGGVFPSPFGDTILRRNRRDVQRKGG